MRKRWVLLPLTLLVVGYLTAVAGAALNKRNDWLQRLCEFEIAANKDPAVCARSDGEVLYIIAGGLVALGLLGFLIRSSTGAATDETPTRRASGSVTEELQRAADLHASGAITDEEFAAVKRRLLS